MLKTVRVSVYIAKDRGSKLELTDVLLLLLYFLLTDVLHLLLLSPFSNPPTIYTPLPSIRGNAPKNEDNSPPKHW